MWDPKTVSGRCHFTPSCKHRPLLPRKASALKKFLRDGCLCFIFDDFSDFCLGSLNAKVIKIKLSVSWRRSLECTFFKYETLSS